jgi:phosphoserine aminotransferase
MSATATAQRVFNFSAGPAALPLPVLQQIQDEMLCLPGAGASVMEISHRGKHFVEILHDAEATLRSLLGISDDYAVLFLQGGSALQFSMIPANLLRGTNRTAQYLLTGSWSKKAIGEAKHEGQVETLYDAKASNYDRVPMPRDYAVNDQAAYLYYCSNETIQGVQFASEPHCPASVPLVSDASSDFLSRPLPIDKYGILYACAQKNAGPAGVTVVVIRKDLLSRGSDDLPGYLNYRNHAENDSCWNTPPTFAIYVLGKIVHWLADDIGGLEAMARQNEQKAQLLYDTIDQLPEFYKGHADPASRSRMNVTFNLPSDELLAKFVRQAADHQLASLEGHRSVGGIRASIYNAMPREGVETLVSFMKDFAAQNG